VGGPGGGRAERGPARRGRAGGQDPPRARPIPPQLRRAEGERPAGPPRRGGQPQAGGPPHGQGGDQGPLWAPQGPHHGQDPKATPFPDLVERDFVRHGLDELSATPRRNLSGPASSGRPSTTSTSPPKPRPDGRSSRGSSGTTPRGFTPRSASVRRSSTSNTLPSAPWPHDEIGIRPPDGYQFGACRRRSGPAPAWPGGGGWGGRPGRR
jgi:hypothetical protein